MNAVVLCLWAEGVTEWDALSRGLTVHGQLCPGGQPWVGVAVASGSVHRRQCGPSPGANTQVRMRRKHQQWGQYRAEGSEGRKPDGNPVPGEDWERDARLWSHGLWRRRKVGLGVPRGSGEQGVRGKGLWKWEVRSLLDLKSGAREPGFTLTKAPLPCR